MAIKKNFFNYFASEEEEREFYSVAKQRCPFCNLGIVVTEQGTYLCDNCRMKYTYNNDVIETCDIQTALYYVFAMFAKFSKAYGVVTEKHIDVVDSIIRDAFKYEGKEKERVVNYFRYAKESEESFNTMCVKFYEIKEEENPKKNGVLYKAVVDFLYQLLLAEEEWSQEQDNMLNVTIAVLGLDKKVVKKIEAKYMNKKSDDIEGYLRVLKCTMGDSLYEIRKSYRNLVKEYHPDKYANLPKFVVDCATEKFHELQEAYEYVQARYSVE